MRLSKDFLAAVTLAAVAFGVFFPAIHHGFLIYDDQQYVTDNSHVQEGLTWSGIRWAFGTFYASNWHPLTWISHMLDCQLFGLHAWGHHLTNVLLHACNTSLLFLLLKRMTGARWRSVFVAAAFGLHPLHVQSVAWVAERKDVLSAFFFFLTLFAYTRYVQFAAGPSQPAKFDSKGGDPGTRWYLLALLFFTFGLMSKPMLVTVPLVLFLIDYWPFARTRSGNTWRLVREKVPFAALSLASSVLTLMAQKKGYAVVSVGGLPLEQRFGHTVISYVHYLLAAFVPRHLAVYYPYPQSTSTSEVLICLLALLLVSALVLLFASRLRYMAVGWFWYLGMLVPVIGLIQVGDQAWADRYTYLPLIGVFIMLSWGSADLVNALGKESERAATRRTVAAVAMAMVLATMAGLTSHELNYWKTSRTLFARAAEVTQNNARAITMLGSLLAEEGKLEDAKSLYAKAIVISPRDPEAHFSLGKALDKQGQLDAAIAQYEQALWFKPLREQVEIFIGLALAKEQKYAEAGEHYKVALEENPDSASAHNDLARVLQSQGRLDEAIDHYQLALKSNPRLAQAHNNLGVLLIEKGRLEEGESQLREAVRLNPDDPGTAYNLASALVARRHWQEAEVLFTNLSAKMGKSPEFHYQLGLSLERLGKTREAMSHYAQALLLKTDYPEALNQLAWVLSTNPDAQIRNGPQAVSMAERACELTAQSQPTMLMTLAAAYAESNRFKESSAALRKAKELADSKGDTTTAKCQRMLESVGAGKPWREDPGSL